MCAISFLTSTGIKLFLPFVARFLFAFFVFVFVLLILTFAFSASLLVPGFLELSELHPKRKRARRQDAPSAPQNLSYNFCALSSSPPSPCLGWNGTSLLRSLI
jgi:hypothetical protein